MSRFIIQLFNRIFCLKRLALISTMASIIIMSSATSTQAACTFPSVLDVTGNNCVFTYTTLNHACDDGSSSTIVSGVSAGNASDSKAPMFQVLANKKLACCLNTETAVGIISLTPKFDCVDNSSPASSDFNALWSSTDSALEGGQLNAMVLVSGKQPITGFYTLTGARCSEFSEFGGTLQPSKVDPLIRSSQQVSVGTTPVAVGAAIPLPASGSGYADLQSRMKKGVPTTQADMFRCPILVRAATVVTCPLVTTLASSGKSYLNSVSDTATSKIYCPLASSISVKIRMEQIYQITGQPTLSPFETTQAAGLSTSISVANIIQQKYGN